MVCIGNQPWLLRARGLPQTEDRVPAARPADGQPQLPSPGLEAGP